MTTPPASRLAWPDQAKGVGILLVVIGHVWRGLQAAAVLPDGSLYQTVDRLIYVFHMPLFFFLSGLFFLGPLSRTPRIFLTTRLTQILWPLTLWTWVFFAFKALAGSLVNHPADWRDFPLWPLPPHEQFWFFWALFVIQCLAFVTLHPLARRKALTQPILALVCLAAFGLVLLPLGGLLPAEWVGAAFRSAGYFCLGLLLAKGLRLARPQLPVPWAVGLFLLCEALALALPASALTDLLPATGAILAVVLGLRAAPVLTWLEPLGQASAAIYVAHVLFSAALRIALLKLGVTALIPHLLLGTLIGLFGPYVLWVVLKRLRLAAVLGLPG